MNKRVIKFSFLLLILISLTQLTFAQDGCPAGEYPVIRLSGIINAHAVSGDTNPFGYSTPICLPNSNNPNPPNRICAGNNKIIRLSGIINAHAESPSFNSNGYIDVCFNEVSCNLILGACPQEEDNILSLSSDTNAHLALLGTPGYSYNLCCTSGASPSSSIYFADGQGGPINKACIGDSVQLIEEGITGTGTRQFEVFKDGTISNELIKTISGISVDATSTAKTRLKLNDVSLNAGMSIAEEDELFFTSTSSGQSSLNLEILPATECTNDKPVAIFSSPKDGGIYFKGEEISFSHSSYDLDSEIIVEWTISDTIIPTEEKTFLQFNHTYQTTGQKIISLKVSDGVNIVNERISILIIGNEGIDTHIYTNISNPANLKAVVGKNVDYDSKSSYVLGVEEQATSFIIKCLGGDCPATTEGCPVGSVDPNACKVTISDTDVKRGIFTELDFVWKFFGIDGEKIDDPDLTGKGIKSGSKMYPNYGQNKIELILGITPKTSNIINMFEITRPSGCTADGKRLFDSSTGSFLDTSIPGVCSGTNKTVGDADDCCPAYTRCVSGDSGSYCSSEACAAFYESGDEGESSIFGIETCYDYNSLDLSDEEKEVQCEADCAAAYLNSIEMDLVELTSGQFIDEERCVWIDDGIDDKCSYSFVKRSSGGTIPPGTEGCIINDISETTTCSNGFKTIEYEFLILDESGTTTPDTQGICGTENTKQVPCGRSAVELPFFTFYNLIFSILGIALIYFIINKRTRK